MALIRVLTDQLLKARPLGRSFGQLLVLEFLSKKILKEKEKNTKTAQKSEWFDLQRRCPTAFVFKNVLVFIKKNIREGC